MRYGYFLNGHTSDQLGALGASESDYMAAVRALKPALTNVRALISNYPRSALAVGATTKLSEIESTISKMTVEAKERWFRHQDLVDRIEGDVKDALDALAAEITAKALQTNEPVGGGGAALPAGTPTGTDSGGGLPQIPGLSDKKDPTDDAESRISWKSFIVPVLIAGGVILYVKKFGNPFARR